MLMSPCIPIYSYLKIWPGKSKVNVMGKVDIEGHNMGPGPRLNIKTVLSTYGDFHVKDKTAVRTSYL